MGAKRTAPWLKPIIKSKKLSGNQSRRRQKEREASNEKLRTGLKKFLTPISKQKPPEKINEISEQESTQSLLTPVRPATPPLASIESTVPPPSPSTSRSCAVSPDNPYTCRTLNMSINTPDSECTVSECTVSPSEETTEYSPSTSHFLEPATASSLSPVRDGVPMDQYQHGTIDPSDPATWPLSLSDVRSWIREQNPQQVHLRTYEPINGRRFASHHFKTKNAEGKVVDRKWLLYSKTTNSLFCFPCCIFSHTNVIPWGQYGRVGCQAYHNLSRAINGHEADQSYHFVNMKRWIEFQQRHENGRNLNQLYDNNVQKEIDIWSKSLKSIFEVVKFLAQNNLPFCGSSSSVESDESGLFLNLIQFLAPYHAPLQEHLSRLEKKSVSYLSPQIQNEFISLLGTEVRSHILKSVQCQLYFSVMFDSTPDSSKKSQTSQCIRSVVCGKFGCHIEEYFIDFIHTNAKTGESLSSVFVEKLTRDKLNMDFCIGQGYDNEAKMAGEYKGVQKWIYDKYPQAEFVPCAAHSLNLIGKNVCENVSEAGMTMGRIQQVYNFFAASPNRWALLMGVARVSLKTQNAVRWSNRWNAVNPLYEQFDKIVALLKTIVDKPENYNPETLAGVEAQLKSINNFRFLLTLSVWHALLGKMEACNKALQLLSLDIERASKLVLGLLNWLEEFRRTGWISCLKESVSKASKMGLSFSGGFGSNRSSPNLSNARSRYKNFEISYFNVIVDALICQFGSRYDKMLEISERFSFLWGLSLDSTDMNIKKDKIGSLVATYPHYLKFAPFCAEAGSLKSYPLSFLPPTKRIHDLDALQILDILYKNEIVSMFPNIETVLRIFLTLPVTIATNERSFSKLKLIKNFLRSTMSQEWLTNLAIISIEKKLSDTLDVDDFIAKFASAKIRRVQF